MISVLARTEQRPERVSKEPEWRAATRYAVAMPLKYRILSNARNSGWRPGRTLDMSARGIRIDIGQRLAAGCKLELAIEWPGLYHGKPMVQLVLVAKVVRVDLRGTALCIL